jgi:hypothetical protein
MIDDMSFADARMHQDRTEIAAVGIYGKRLTYWRTGIGANL